MMYRYSVLYFLNLSLKPFFFHRKRQFLWKYPTRNTLTQASKNGRKPYLLPQKKFVSVFYAINIFNTIYYFKPTNFIVCRENAFCKFHTFFFGFFLPCFLFTMLWNRKLDKMYWCHEVCIYTQKYTRIWKVYLNYSECTWKVLILLYMY